MIITVQRFTDDDRPTIGQVSINGRPVCFSLEDRQRDVKVAGDTRIPAGEYALEWRKTGKWAQRFKKQGYPGSLELMDVPGFTDVLIHVGNTKRDTAGCLLLGMGADMDAQTITKSRIACNVLYARIAYGLDNAAPVTIDIQDAQ